MGSEFLKKTRRTNEKSLDKGRIGLGTPDLFTQRPYNEPRSVVAKLENGASLSKGQKVILQPNGKALCAVIGNTTMATVESAPGDVVSGIDNGCGVARGEVSQVNPLSKTVELTIC